MRRKLIRKGHPELEVDEALAKLAGRGYLDDDALAAAEARRLRERRSLAGAAIAADLRRRGASRSAIDAATSGSAGDEPALARAAAERWLRAHAPRPAALARHLDRKGFPPHLIRELLDELVPAAADEES